MNRIVTLAVLVTLLAVSALAGDNLYLVEVNNPQDVGGLLELESKVVHYGSDGIVVLIDTDKTDQLNNSDLEYQLLARSVTVDRLATDARREKLPARGFQPVYEDGGFRLYLVDEPISASQLTAMELQALRPGMPLSEFQPPVSFEGQFASPEDLMDLQTLIGMVEMDSLWSYVTQLQALAPRVAGTASNRNARDWIKSQLEEFGYANVKLDTFDVQLSGVPSQCYNVVATKIGTRYPDHKIVVGAHFDAVTGSPGADDNGSGTSGVLELARILKDIDTDMTFEFVLFDAEEYGLIGAWNFATNSWLAGDEIVFMQNMDMIAYIANNNQADVFYGSDVEYAIRYMELADSLLSLTVIPQGGSSASDHYPFSQFGIPVVFAAENAFSTVYHTYQDSTSYMSAPYMTKLVKIALATTYWVSQAEGPVPSLQIEYTSIPNYALPEETTEINLTIQGVWDGLISPGSEQIHYQIDDGAWSVEPLTDLGGGAYSAALPAADCGSVVSYYASANEPTTGDVYQPDPAAPRTMTVATDYLVDFADDFETDQGWTTSVSASSGQWQRGVPVNDLGWGYDPITDGDGSGICFLTQNEMGNTDVDGGSVRLISPVIDYSSGGSIEYDYYLRMTNAPGVDMLLVEGNDGDGVWREITRHIDNMGVFWTHHAIPEADILVASLTKTATFQIRFTVNDSDPQSIVEAGIDGFTISHYLCADPCCGRYNGGYTGNVNCDDQGKVNLTEIIILIDHVYLAKQPLCCMANGNTDGDLDNKINLADITRLIDHVYISKTRTAACM